MKLTAIAALTLFACVAFAQDGAKSKPADGPATATAQEVKAKANSGAASIDELPHVKTEVEREKRETERLATASKEKAAPKTAQGTTSAQKVQQTDKTSSKPIDRKK